MEQGTVNCHYPRGVVGERAHESSELRSEHFIKGNETLDGESNWFGCLESLLYSLKYLLSTYCILPSFLKEKQTVQEGEKLFINGSCDGLYELVAC